jgi:hypothetical protein
MLDFPFPRATGSALRPGRDKQAIITVRAEPASQRLRRRDPQVGDPLTRHRIIVRIKDFRWLPPLPPHARRPDDWHLHLRDGTALASVVGATAASFGEQSSCRTCGPPVTTVDAALAYRDRIRSAAGPSARSSR